MAKKVWRCQECGSTKKGNLANICATCYYRDFSHKYYLKNRKKKRAYDRRYYSTHRDKIKKATKDYQKEHPEKKREYNRKYYGKNLEDIRDGRNKYKEKWKIVDDSPEVKRAEQEVKK